MSKKRKLLIGIGIVCLLAATLFGVWKTVYLSADIDESYAVTLGVRIAHGDKVFREMWEVHQTSAVLYAPFIAIYEKITGGVEGILVYLRLLGIVIQGVIACCMFDTLKKWVHPAFALLLSFLFFNFTPKHIQSPEFTQLLYWGVTIMSLSMLAFFKNYRMRYLIPCGIALSICVLAYPYAILLFPVCLAILLIKCRDKGKRNLLYICLALSLVCLFCAMIFLGFVFQGITWNEFLTNLPYIFMDESHSHSMVDMLMEHVRTHWHMLYITFGIIILTHVSRIVYRHINKRNGRVIFVFAFFVQIVFFFLRFHTIEKVNYIQFLPIILQMLVLLVYVFWSYESQEHIKPYASEDTVATVNENAFFAKLRSIFAALVLPSVTAYVAVLLSSNLSAEYSVGFLLPALLGMQTIVFLILGREERGNAEVFMGKLSQRALAQRSFVVMLAVFTLLLFASRVFLVRFTSTQRKNIFENYYEMNHGALKGIRLSEFDFKQYDAKVRLLYEQVEAEDVFLYVGCDMFLYSMCEGLIGTGNTISTPAFGEQLLAYYKEYPDRMPTVIFVDREYVADFDVVLHEEPFQSFINENYVLDESIENVPVNVYRR